MAPPVPRMRIHTPEIAKPEETPGGTAVLERCGKHSEPATEHCRVCSRPICPKCMELFGYVCSPLCKAKAGSYGVQIPVYEGQKSILDARRWRKAVWAGSAGSALVVALAALWGWYAWFGCAPTSAFSVRFSEPAYSGQSAIGGKHQDQIVFLHGATLARYDFKS